jgi:hypothetical protein
MQRARALLEARAAKQGDTRVQRMGMGEILFPQL